MRSLWSLKKGKRSMKEEKGNMKQIILSHQCKECVQRLNKNGPQPPYRPNFCMTFRYSENHPTDPALPESSHFEADGDGAEELGASGLGIIRSRPPFNRDSVVSNWECYSSCIHPPHPTFQSSTIGDISYCFLFIHSFLQAVDTGLSI